MGIRFFNECLQPRSRFYAGAVCLPIVRGVLNQPGLGALVAKGFFNQLEFRFNNLFVATQGNLRMLMCGSLNPCTQLCGQKPKKNPGNRFCFRLAHAPLLAQQKAQPSPRKQNRACAAKLLVDAVPHPRQFDLAVKQQQAEQVRQREQRQGGHRLKAMA